MHDETQRTHPTTLGAAHRNYRLRSWVIVATGLGIGLSLMHSAQAHMPYLLPNAFDASARDHVSVIASFTEAPFVADVTMKSDHYSVITPAGALLPIAPVNYLRDLAAFEVPTTENGLYRITSGERLGRKAEAWRKPDGAWEFVGENNPAPTDAKIVEIQSVTTADAYVLRGRANATDKALLPTGKGVEIKLVTHPDAINAHQPMQAELLFEGKPLADAGITIYRGTLDGLGDRLVVDLKSDMLGRFSFTAPAVGTYLALIRHRTEAPVGAETPWRSYSYTLTFVAQ